jgi:hypothetical protein
MYTHSLVIISVVLLQLQHLSDVLIKGVSILQSTYEDKEVVVMYCEGILEHFFSKHLSVYDEADMQWFFNFLANPNHDTIRSAISSDVAKFFLKRILTVQKSSSVRNFLRLFDDRVSAQLLR